MDGVEEQSVLACGGVLVCGVWGDLAFLGMGIHAIIIQCVQLLTVML